MRPYPVSRMPGELVSPSRRIAYAAAVRRLLEAEPKMSVEAMVRKTGAPRRVVEVVRRRMAGEQR